MPPFDNVIIAYYFCNSIVILTAVDRTVNVLYYYVKRTQYVLRANKYHSR